MLGASREEGKEGEKFRWKDHDRIKSIIFREEKLNNWSTESVAYQERKTC